MIAPAKKGFTLLFNLLLVGAFGFMVLLTLQKQSIGDIQSQDFFYKSIQAEKLAQGCLNLALDKVSHNRFYLGNEEFVILKDGYCFIREIKNQTLEVIGTYQEHTQSLKIKF